MYHTPLNTINQVREGEGNTNNQRLFSSILNENVNSVPTQNLNSFTESNSLNNNTHLFHLNTNNNVNRGNNVSLSDELPLLELNDLSLVEPSTSQNFRVRSLLNPRSHTQSQHRFHNKKLLRPKLLQQRNSREKKFPFTTIKSIFHFIVFIINITFIYIYFIYLNLFIYMFK